MGRHRYDRAGRVPRHRSGIARFAPRGRPRMVRCDARGQVGGLYRAEDCQRESPGYQENGQQPNRYSGDGSARCPVHDLVNCDGYLNLALTTSVRTSCLPRGWKSNRAPNPPLMEAQKGTRNAF